MKFTIIRSKFLEGLQKVQNIVSSKHNVPILQNALLKAEDGKLYITTTDVDISQRCCVECEVEVAGSTTLPVKRLYSAIRELNEGKIAIEVNDNITTVQSGSTYFKIIGLDTSYFPPVPVAEGSFCYKIDQGILVEMLRKTSYAASDDETRRMLNGVLMAFKDSKLTIVATDGRRLALVEQELEITPEAENELILPSKAVNELMRIMSNEGEAKIYFQTNQVVIEFDNIVFSSKLIDAVYPNYRQVLPGACDEKVVIEREALLSALRRVSVIATDKSNATRLIFSNNQLVISLNTPDVGESRDSVPIKYAGKEISVVFNSDYVMDPLRNLDDDEVYFEMNDGNSPALLKCSEPFVYVLMPLRIN